MHNFNAQPSPSYQSLVPRPEEKFDDEHELHFNTYSVDRPLSKAQSYEDHQQENLKLKTTIRILRFISRLAATAIAAITTSQQSVTFSTYLETRNVHRDGRGPWTKGTSLWPTLVLLIASAITTILGVMILIAYLFSVKKANAISSAQTWTSMIVEVGHILIWIVVAILYRVGKSGKDLWGWACSPLAQNIQPNFNGVVHFSRVCSRGSSSWHLALGSAAVQLLSGIVWLLIFRRMGIQRTMKQYG